MQHLPMLINMHASAYHHACNLDGPVMIKIIKYGITVRFNEENWLPEVHNRDNACFVTCELGMTAACVYVWMLR